MLNVVLSVDCERFVSFSQINPRWNRFEIIKGRINNSIKNFRYNKKGFDIVLNALIKENFPATLMFVEKEFKEIKLPNFLEKGYHTKDHLPLTLISYGELEKQVKNNWKVKSITAPMWMIEDIKNPSRIFKILKKEGYSHCVYRGENEGIKHFHYNAVKEPVKKEGVICVHVSNWFEGNTSKNQIKKIKEDILNNLDKKGIYLLTTHDFTHKKNNNFLEIILFLKRLEKDGKIKLKKLKEIK